MRYIFLLARRAYSWLFQLAQMWKLLTPGVGLGDLLTPAYSIAIFINTSIYQFVFTCVSLYRSLFISLLNHNHLKYK